jgi:hypothetical protein
MPELKGRSLEDVDELFAAGLPAWRFKQYECTGINTDALASYQAKLGDDKGEERVELENV